METNEWMLDRNRQERLIARIDEILRLRPEGHSLNSRFDVLVLAVEQLWRATLASQPDSRPTSETRIKTKPSLQPVS